MALSNSYNGARSLIGTRLYLVLFRKVSISEGHEGRYSVEFTSRRGMSLLQFASTFLIIISLFEGQGLSRKE